MSENSGSVRAGVSQERGKTEEPKAPEAPDRRTSGADQSETVELPTSHGCFVCGEHNPHGLQLRFERLGETVLSRFELDQSRIGFDGRTHGGIVAALLDEAMGWVTILASHRFTYTVELNVRYLKPVPVGQPLHVEAWSERHTRRLSFAAARIVDPSSGETLAEGRGKFMMTGEVESRQIAEQLIYRDGSWKLPEGDPNG